MVLVVAAGLAISGCGAVATTAPTRASSSTSSVRRRLGKDAPSVGALPRGAVAAAPPRTAAASHPVKGGPAVSVSSMAVDPARPGLVVGVLRINPSAVRLQLLAGSKEPGNGVLQAGSVPPADQPKLLAAFNAGFLTKQSKGGWFSQGVTAVPLAAGAASLVFRDNGVAQVGIWGRDVSMDPHVVAVRQNLSLLIDGGIPTPAASSPDFEGVWGKTIRHLRAVPRSGIGITKDGSLVYVAGKGLVVGDLVTALMAAGAQRAMELDINPMFVDAYTYNPGPAGPVGQPITPGLRYGPEHYLQSQTRDFVEVLSR